MQHHLIEIIEKVNLESPLDTTKKSEKIDRFFDIKVTELTTKIFKRLFDAASF